MTRLKAIERQIVSARVELDEAARRERDCPVGSPSYMKVMEIVDDLMERIEQLVLARALILLAREVRDESTLQ
jgi:hypothetical protein